VLEIPPRFDRSAYRDQAKAAESAAFLLRYVCEILGVDDLGGRDVLDVGCGTKFSQGLINSQLPIGSYVGIDVYGEMIEFLKAHISDPRFEYHHVNVRNELYNPDAPPMTERTDLGVGDRRFDVIWLFSVFTHLAPEDYITMLRLLRRYVRPDGRLFYTVFINELTEGGHGYVDGFYRVLRDNTEGDAVDVDRENERRVVPPFVDVDPEHPLRWALYSREYAHELIEGTGWKPLELLPPVEFAQHQFVCAPV
jgi:SAM-dependent methyltransferase